MNKHHLLTPLEENLKVIKAHLKLLCPYKPVSRYQLPTGNGKFILS